MKRRFNYTGRGRIPQEKISIILNKKENSVSSFTATIDLSGMGLPPEAKIYIETYHRTEYKSFDFGTVGNILPPSDTSLLGLVYTGNLKFRILVVDELSGHNGLILANVDGLKPVSDIGTKSILPVEFCDIGQQIWRVDFDGTKDPLVLNINNQIPNIEHVSKFDPRFILYVYPAVIREILTHIVFVDRVNPSDPEMGWHKEWLDFSRIVLAGEDSPKVLDPQDDDFDEETTQRWINKVVEEFCSSRMKEWKGYISKINEEGQ